MKLERASNRGSLATYVRNVETFAELSINPPIAEGWLKSMARLVESMPDDLRKEIRCIGYHSDNTWPPNRDGDWNPGYLIHANPDLIMSAHERQWLSDVFFRVDGGHPGIGWLFPNVPWIDGKPGRDSLDAPELDPEHEIELYIDPGRLGCEIDGVLWFLAVEIRRLIPCRLGRGSTSDMRPGGVNDRIWPKADRLLCAIETQKRTFASTQSRGSSRP